ncbi:MAG TPA: hypothetical protein PLO69_11000 [Gammaproteobacteria bacterium]|nr:hypothetical protein [Gammaproteobacteria bacterium]
MSQIRIKAGDSFLLQGLLTDDFGTPIPLASVGITGQVRDVTGNLVETLVVTVTAAPGIFTVTVPDTSLWPVGTLRGDFRIAINGLTERSDTFGITVGRSVTP